MYRDVVKVFAPASVANVGVGYDILGYAIDGPGDEIIARRKETGVPGVYISKISGDGGLLPKETLKNTASFAGQALLKELGLDQELRIEFEVFKKMPFGSGLGSSAASAVAGVMAVNELLKRPLQKREMLPFAVAGEEIADGAYHADNVAPSLLGGLILIRDNQTLDIHKVHVPAGLISLVVYPKVEVLTKKAREIISGQVELGKFISQTGNLAAFVLGMQTSNYELIERSLRDVVIEEQRAQLIPHFYDVKEIMITAGALGSSISGSGPSIFGLFHNSMFVDKAKEDIEKLLTQKGIEHQIFISPINMEGAKLL